MFEAPGDAVYLVWLGIRTWFGSAPGVKLRDVLGKCGFRPLEFIRSGEPGDGASADRAGGVCRFAGLNPPLSTVAAHGVTARVNGGWLVELLEANWARHDSG